MNTMLLLLLVSLVCSLEYKLLQVDMTIVNGFSKTSIKIDMFNPSAEPKMSNLTFYIPELASISSTQLNVNGKIFKGIVLESSIAKQRYEQAKSEGRTTGLVQQVRATSIYTLSFFVGANQYAQFSMSYEELLSKRFGNYESWAYLRPGFVAQNISMNVLIQESSGIKTFTAPSFASASVTQQVFTPGAKQATLRYYVSKQDQEKKLPFVQDLLIQYAIADMTAEGLVFYAKGHFVHLFAPTGLPKMGKNLVFALDNSGSMSGNKMEQAKTAVSSIVGKLTDADYFNIVVFSDTAVSWKGRNNMLIQATSSNKQEAQSFVATVKATGGTNINDAMLAAIETLNQRQFATSSGIIVLLTDGQPTVGETNTKNIRANIIRANQNRFAVFCLGFGFDLDYILLRNIAYQNGGFDKRIYEDVDAAQQIAGYYDEISSPVLTNVQLAYTMLGNAKIANLTRSWLKMLAEGSQYLVAGRIENLPQDQTGQVRVAVSAQSATGLVSYDKVFDVRESSDVDVSTESIWAFKTIHDSLRDMYLEQSDASGSTASYNKVLALALKYQLVTPVTAMVVEQTNETATTENPFVNNGKGFASLACGTQGWSVLLWLAVILACVL